MKHFLMICCLLCGLSLEAKPPTSYYFTIKHMHTSYLDPVSYSFKKRLEAAPEHGYFRLKNNTIVIKDIQSHTYKLTGIVQEHTIVFGKAYIWSVLDEEGDAWSVDMDVLNIMGRKETRVTLSGKSHHGKQLETSTTYYDYFYKHQAL